MQLRGAHFSPATYFPSPFAQKTPNFPVNSLSLNTVLGPNTTTATATEASAKEDSAADNDAVTKAFIFKIRFILEGIVVAVICNVGILGNLLSMFILLKRKLDLQPFLTQLLVLLVEFFLKFFAGRFLLRTQRRSIAFLRRRLV